MLKLSHISRSVAGAEVIGSASSTGRSARSTRGVRVRVSLSLPRVLRAHEELHAQLAMLARLAIESGFKYVNFMRPDYLYLTVRDGAPALHSAYSSLISVRLI